MNGLDKIVEEIHRQAELEAAEILNKADEYCETYMAEARAKVNEEVAEYNKKAQAARELYEAKTKSGMEFKERNAILSTKQQCINDCLIKALDKVRNLPDEDYFKMLENILKTNVQKADGIMKLNEKDLERIPESFESRIKNIAEGKGGNLEVSRESAPINDGFILVYGDVEENCTLKSLFDANKDKLKDIANKELFGTSANKSGEQAS